jgi:Family of unknown function (DUF6527)
MRVTQLEPRFIEERPTELEDGVLYISVGFRTSVHLCCCGCRNEVWLPIRPTRWKFTYDGEAVSLSPSVGNWSFPCQSHYWIRGLGQDLDDQDAVLPGEAKDRVEASPVSGRMFLNWRTRRRKR